MNFEVLPGTFLIYNQAQGWYVKLDEGLKFGPFKTYAESIKKARSILVCIDDAI